MKSEQLPEDGIRVSNTHSRRGVGRGNWPRKTRETAITAGRSTTKERKTRQLSPNGDYRRRASYDRQLDSHDLGQDSSPPPDAPTPTNGVNGNGPHGYYLPLSGAAPAQASGSKRQRPLTAHQVAMEQSRRERVEYLLDKSMRALQASSLKERSRRGVIVDAWMKCCELSDGWDSEVDGEDGQMGGISDVLRHYDDEDDIGERARGFARGFRRVGRSLDGLKIGTTTKRKRRTEEDLDDVIDAALPDEAETPRLKRPYKRRTAAARSSGMDSSILESASAPRTGRRGQRGGTPRTASASRSRRATGRGRGGGGMSRSALSQAVFSAIANLEAEDAAKQAEARAGAAAVEDEEIDEMDRELLGDVGAEESDGERGRGRGRGGVDDGGSASEGEDGGELDGLDAEAHGNEARDDGDAVMSE